MKIISGHGGVVHVLGKSIIGSQASPAAAYDNRRASTYFTVITAIAISSIISANRARRSYVLGETVQKAVEI